MQQSSYYIPFKGLLNETQLTQIHQLIASSAFEDGKNTATDAARSVKNNLQLQNNTQSNMAIQQIIMTAINNHFSFRQAVLPKQVYPFLISCYEPGMSYGWHVDSPIMGNLFRTDLAITIFLNDPAEYDGGELELQSPEGTLLYKLNKGDAICYPCSQLHRVRDVVNGKRLVAVSWIHSMIKEPNLRSMLFDMNQIQTSLHKKDDLSPEANLLMQLHSNLLRLWSDI